MQQLRNDVGPIERARALGPLLDEAGDEIERERQLPERVVSALVENGLFRMMLPRSVGGGEVEPLVYVQALEELGKHDGSTAWSIGQNSGCSMASAYLDPAIAREVFGDPRRGILAWGPFAPPSGKALVAKDGYKVTGRWGFASGSRHASWLGAHSLVFEADGTTPVKTKEGKHEIRTFIFPKGKAEIVDNWQVIGLRGTGSDTYVINDLPVAKEYTFIRDSFDYLRETGPLFKFTSGMMYAAAFSNVSMGIARGAFDAFMKFANEKVPRGGQKTMAHNNVIQAEVAKCDAKLRTSRAYVHECIGALWEEAHRGNRGTREQLRQFRLAATWAINQAQEVVNSCYTMAGSSAIFDTHPLERRLRDIHAGTQQGQGRPVQYEHVGQVMLGLENEAPLFR